jgi:Fe-S cluster assembly iron-binding protein IscA
MKPDLEPGLLARLLSGAAHSFSFESVAYHCIYTMLLRARCSVVGANLRGPNRARPARPIVTRLHAAESTSASAAPAPGVTAATVEVVGTADVSTTSGAGLVAPGGPPITLTDAALAQLQKLRAENANSGALLLRVGVKSGGCGWTRGFVHVCWNTHVAAPRQHLISAIVRLCTYSSVPQLGTAGAGWVPGPQGSMLHALTRMAVFVRVRHRCSGLSYIMDFEERGKITSDDMVGRCDGGGGEGRSGRGRS